MATHNLLLERPSGAPAPKRQSLYAPRKKIYPKRASGRFRQFKWLVMLITLTIYYVTPWIRWDRGPGAPDQAVLVDLANRRFFFFFISPPSGRSRPIMSSPIGRARDLVKTLLNDVHERMTAGPLAPSSRAAIMPA